MRNSAKPGRVQAEWEAEELRAATLALEDELQEATARGEGLQSQLGRTEHELQGARASMAHLEVVFKMLDLRYCS